MQLKESGIQFPLTNNPESMTWNPETKTVLDSLTWGNTVACVAGTGIFWGRKEKIRGRAREGRKGEGTSSRLRVFPSRILEKKLTGACYLGYNTEAAECLIRYELPTIRSHTLSEVTRSNLNHKARFGSYEAQKSYTLQQEWEKNGRIFPSVPYN